MSLVCSWNEVGMSHVQVSSSPFCARPSWRMPKNQPEVFQTEVFSWMSARDVCTRMLVFLQELGRLTEAFGQMSAAISGQNLPLWADSFVSDYLDLRQEKLKKAININDLQRSCVLFTCPLARNQYINDSSKVFSVFARYE